MDVAKALVPDFPCVVGVREVAVERMVLRDECGSRSGEREDGEIV